MKMRTINKAVTSLIWTHMVAILGAFSECNMLPKNADFMVIQYRCVQL